ncbi:MAG: RluA family pseudouridine synthase [Mariprofundus sp.]|nr:RluA family pseudouridine synthase [Mariprofundus sp.]
MNNASSHNILSFCIPEAQDGKRLDAALATLSGLSRNHIQQLLKSGHVCNISGKIMQQPSLRVFEDDTYNVHIPPLEALNLEPEDIPLDILFEDEHIIVINKPAGMVVHPAHGHDRGTLVHALLFHCDTLSGINGMQRPGIVHRLDKDTSGSLVVAKSEIAHRQLSEMFAEHNLNRQYIAWCRGNPRWRQKCIELPIARHPQHRQKMAVNPNGKEAITNAQVEQLFGPFSRLRLTLHTGRTHQIRVHLSHELLPILGDPVYARSYNPASNIPDPTHSAITALKRQALHAELLEFEHPVSGEALSFRAPLPDDLNRLSQSLKKNYG